MKKRIALIAQLILFCCVLGIAQDGSVVYNRLKQKYGWACYHSTMNGYTVKQNGFAGYCDINGREIVPPNKYTGVSWNKDDKYFEVKIGDKLGVLDENGREIIAPTKYTYIIKYSTEDGYNVKNGDFAGYCDINGREIVPPNKYTGVSWNKDDKYFKVKIGDKVGILDENCNELIPPTKYTYVYWDKINNYFAVKIGDKAGALEENSREIVAPNKYTYVSWYKNGKYFTVKIGDKVGVLDSTGKELVRPVIKGDYINYYYKEKCYTIGEYGDDKYKTVSFKLYSKDGKELFVSKYPESIWPEKHDDFGGVSEGLAKIKCGDLWGYMDVANGRMVIPAQYTSAEKFEDGMAKVSKGNESFLISNPLKGGGGVVSSLSLGSANKTSDIDNNIPENSNKQENTFAVVIANQNYPNFEVRHALSDGSTFRQYCEKTLGIPAINVIYYEDATLNNVRSAMTRIHDLADAYEGDARIIFYYAGQGVTDNSGHPYLMPVDATVGLIASTGYSVEALYSELGSLDVKSAIVLLDAGFSNEDREGKTIGDGRGVAPKTKNASVAGKVVVVTAASNGEAARLYDEKNHGLFTYYLCKKMQETKGNVTMDILSEYIKTNVAKASLKMGEKVQTPRTISSESITLKNLKL